MSLHLTLFMSNASYFCSLGEFGLGETETASCIGLSGGPRQVKTELDGNSQTKFTLLFLDPGSRVLFWELRLLWCRRWGRAGTGENATKRSYYLKSLFLEPLFRWLL